MHARGAANHLFDTAMVFPVTTGRLRVVRAANTLQLFKFFYRAFHGIQADESMAPLLRRRIDTVACEPPESFVRSI
jgi:hypothetical protein